MKSQVAINITLTMLIVGSLLNTFTLQRQIDTLEQRYNSLYTSSYAMFKNQHAINTDIVHILNRMNGFPTNAPPAQSSAYTPQYKFNINQLHDSQVPPP